VARGQKSRLYFVPPSPPEGSAARKSKETFTSVSFIEMITKLKAEVDTWFLGQRYSIIMDHASQHKSKASTKALADLHAPVKDDFPARSWDLNVIENVWGVLDDYMLHKAASSNEELRAAIQEAWDCIQLDTITKLVDSVVDRMRAVNVGNGQWLSKNWDTLV
jgi:hypothetical protein